MNQQEIAGMQENNRKIEQFLSEAEPSGKTGQKKEINHLFTYFSASFSV